MKPILNLADGLIRKGRNLQRWGLDQKALGVFQSLRNWRDLPPHLHMETNSRLSRLHRKSRHYRRARRHLAVLLAANPNRAAYHYQMARLVQVDMSCDPLRARKHFRKALELDPDNARYLTAYGVFALNNDREKLALRLLRRAYRLKPDCPIVLKRYLRSLEQLGRVNEGNRVLCHCRFRLGKKTWFQKLQNDFRFFQLESDQKSNRRGETTSKHVSCRILPFPDVKRELLPSNFGETRNDEPSVLSSPHFSLRLHRPDQRNAQ